MQDDAFLHWLAGFIDGEGCFSINGSATGRRAYSCSFDLGLREDDSAILDEMVRRLGIGKVYYRVTGRSQCRIATWTLRNKRDCLMLVEILDEHPLRAKKARDYAIWREAVLEWETVSQFDWRDDETLTERRLSRLRLGELKVALSEGRRHAA